MTFGLKKGTRSKPTPAGAAKPDELTRRRRIAVLGLENVETSSIEWVVHSFPWSYQGQTSVVADYDVAVVNLLDTGPQEGFIARGLPPEADGDIVLDLLRAAGRLVLSGGELVVLGHPEVHVKSRRHGLPGQGRYWTTLPYWTGMEFQWDERPGDQIEILVEEGRAGPERFGGFVRARSPDSALPFRPYLQQLRRYNYALVNAEVSKDAEHLAGPPPGPRERAFRADTRRLAENRHDGRVATEHLIEVRTRPTARRQDGWTVQHYGRVVLLPTVGLAPLDTVGLLLRAAYGVHVVLPAPAWLAQIKAPGDSRLVAALEAAQAAIDTAQATVSAAEAERARARDVLRVVTAHDDDLEQRVRDLLRRLGGEVEDPAEQNKEDGWLRVDVGGQILHGVLEIKSTRKAMFDEKGLRQLFDWVARSDRDRKRNHKGIFIGNSAYAQPPGERDDPFSSSFRQTAEDNGFVALTASSLLRELARVVDEGAAAAAFWRRLFETRGVLE